MSKVRLRQNFRFRGLGNMYAEDERFARNYEAVKKGLSEFLKRAMNAYCDAIEKTG
jgi:hypothetical protein